MEMNEKWLNRTKAISAQVELIHGQLKGLAGLAANLTAQMFDLRRELDRIASNGKERLEKAGWTYFRDGMWVEPNHAFVLQEEQALWYLDRAAIDDGIYSLHEIYTFIALGWQPTDDGWCHKQMGRVTNPDVMRQYLNRYED